MATINKCSIVSPAESNIFFSSSVHSIEHIEQKSIQERKELNFFSYQFINTDKKEFI